ncbi:extracellular solute-binding protein [Jiangella alkaliphila]|uniref:Carbohydrate ABC transporter substrate-binding protein, CUT1 family n=1 Tax=Jiangella alkaliphila TaxID=419479 RepID=A0A1H2LBX1_9ACTN|nr:extracellular solute-binding protein [Jiangella alkaliphila]SDU77926.1 carbohydrate ABC transporter substrate-binding protein, CUT1 family [Jiangella alkaliphila]
MKRSTALLLAAGLTAGLAACSGDDGDDNAAASDGPLTVWIMGDSGTNFEQLVAPFTDDTGIDVEVVAIPWDGVDQRLTTAVASGDGPDVLQVGLSKLRTFADAGALLPLDDALEDRPALDPGNFAEGVAGEATAVGGEIVSVPWISDTRVLFYRSDILAENGIDQPPATWDQLRDDAATLAGRGDGQYGYYVPQWDSPLPVIMTWDQGGDIVGDDGAVSFDTPEFAAAVDLYTGLYEDGSVPTNADFDQTQGFISGVTPMLISGPYLAKAISDAAPELDGAWDVTTVPEAESGTSLFAGSNLALWHDTPNEDAALDLLEFLSAPETQLSWYEINGELPTVTAALEDDALTADPQAQVYVDQLADARVLPMVPNWDGGVGADLLTALNEIVLNGADRDSALADLYTKTGSVSID